MAESMRADIEHRIADILQSADLTVIRCSCSAIATLDTRHDWPPLLRQFLAEMDSDRQPVKHG